MPWDSILNNVAAWSMQVLALATLGAVLPLLFRLRHPRTQLAYYHAVLIVCLLLPLAQPWQHPVFGLDPDSEQADSGELSAESSTAATRPTESSAPIDPPPVNREIPAFDWKMPAVVASVLVAGILARLAWLVIGLWRIRQHRIGATPLYPVPESVQAAAAITHANALFCVSSSVAGPVTMGWLAPVVLLPESFADLGEEAQCAVACHELLHVRRNDWLVTLLEEAVGALLWFNPAIWLLLSQTRLVREQLVDAEVVKLTAAREPYIDALLSIARGRPELDLAPAPLFLRRRHLTHRMHALLKDASMSPLRLFSAYGSMTAILGVTAWFALGAFPLVGDPQFQANTAIAPPADSASANAAVPQPQSSVPETVPTIPSPSTPAPLPSSIYEPITGLAEDTREPADRAAALSLVERAKQSAKLHMPDTPPFTLRATFQAWGDVTYTGFGEMTENWRNGQNWRWSAQFGDFAAAEYSMAGRLMTTSGGTPTPMRVQSLRNAIFWAVRNTPANANIRTASVQWNGRPVTCILFGPTSASKDAPATRRLNEEEYCFDAASGLLQIYSFVPGSYVAYSYAKNRIFHGRPQADRIVFYSGGSMAMDAQLDITDLGDVEPNAGVTDAAAVDRPSVPLSLPLRGPMLGLVESRDSPGTAIVHATYDPSGRVIEAEVVTATDATAAQKGLHLVRSAKFDFPSPAKGKQGALMQREMFVNVRIGQ